MSHPEQLAFFSLVSDANQELIPHSRVLEIGSYDVNGSVRGRFSGAREYVGIDLTDGPGVDRIGYGHEIDDPDGTYDITLSGECFEHDPHFRETFATMVRLTRPGGLVAFTCASRGRPEHGTRRTSPIESPGTQAEGLDYYRNLTMDDFVAFEFDAFFSEWRFWYIATSFDLYFAGVRVGPRSARLPADPEVRRIRSLMTLPYRAIRWPLRAALAVTGGGPAYQKVVRPYWRAAGYVTNWAEDTHGRHREENGS